MGSYSSTSVPNNAAAIQDNTNPVVLAGSNNARLGSDNLSGNRFDSDSNSLSGGAQINTLDGGAIDGAFKFADSAVLKLFDLTSKTIEQNRLNNVDFLKTVTATNQSALGAFSSASDSAQTAFATAAEGTENTLVKKFLIGAAALAGLFLILRYSKLGK